MFRLPPTSIGLSQNDLNLHLHQIDIFQDLLKQGFRKKDIIQHFQKQKSSWNGQSKDGDDRIHAQKAPSLLELSFRRQRNPGLAIEDDLIPTSNSVESSSPSSTESPHLVVKADRSQVPETAERNAFKTSETLNVYERTSLGIEVTSRHAPRNSSLLRFTQTISSEASPNERSLSLSVSPRGNIKYRPRSNTYSYEQSEVDDSHSDYESSQEISQSLEHLTLSDELLPIARSIRVVSPTSSTLSPEAQEFSPLQLSPSHATASADNVQWQAAADAGLIIGQRNDLQPILHSEVRSRTDPIAPNLTDSSLAFLGSSPPNLPGVAAEDDSELKNSFSPQLVMPSTPYRPGKPRCPKMHKTLDHQYLDGTFTVYNDMLPASSQPQTPADLNTDLESGYSAAYTAPPGMVRSDFSRGGHFIQRLRQTSSEQSPTRRAMVLHARREREFMRGAHVEARRIGRRRQLSHVSATIPADDGRRRPIEEELESWRDDLDADRVGEENFDEGGSMTTLTNGMRVVSGNRR